jgi:hypothetical protein
MPPALIGRVAPRGSEPLNRVPFSHANARNPGTPISSHTCVTKPYYLPLPGNAISSTEPHGGNCLQRLVVLGVIVINILHLSLMITNI